MKGCFSPHTVSNGEIPLWDICDVCLLSFHLTPFHLDALKGILLIEIQIKMWSYYIGHKNFMYEKYTRHVHTYTLHYLEKYFKWQLTTTQELVWSS